MPYALVTNLTHVKGSSKQPMKYRDNIINMKMYEKNYSQHLQWLHTVNTKSDLIIGSKLKSNEDQGDLFMLNLKLQNLFEMTRGFNTPKTLLITYDI